MTKAFILVVDDDNDIRETIIDALSDEGIPALGARDGLEALNILRAGGPLPAVIFLDLMMPGMSGADFLVTLRVDPAMTDVPIVVISADASVYTKAAVLGVADVMRKPIKLQVLLETAKRFLGTAP